MTKAKRKSYDRVQREARIMKELALDLDWEAAAQRAGVPMRTVNHWLQNDQAFRERGQKLIDKAIGERSGIDDAVKRFRNTQKILEEELASGNLDVSNAMIKTHEMEFKMHGLFEKDNKQKGQSVNINISFDKNSAVNIDGEEVIDHG